MLLAPTVDNKTPRRDLDISRVLDYLDRERMENAALGYAVRRVAQEATPAQAAAFLAVVLETLRRYPAAHPPSRRTGVDNGDATPSATTNLREQAKAAVLERVKQNVHTWAPVNASEVDVLVDWIVAAVDDRSLEYTYPIIEGEDGRARMLRAPAWTASAVTADGRAETLRRVADEVRRLVTEVRSWEVWLRLRPGPV